MAMASCFLKIITLLILQQNAIVRGFHVVIDPYLGIYSNAKLGSCIRGYSALYAAKRKRRKRKTTKEPLKIERESKVEEEKVEMILEKEKNDQVANLLASDNEESPTFDLSKKPNFGTGAIDLPDIKESIKKKAMAKEQQEEEKKQIVKEKKKISRKDLKSVTKLLEVEPQAGDYSEESYFEQEQYGTVSVLLAEGAKPFLGIPSSVLQIGHFIGVLGILIMAFIEYPGFPLTNLPTPLRISIQGGLGTVFSINFILAVLSAFEAPKRGQPMSLWAIKAFTLGGLAYDQLTQLPTSKNKN